MYTYGAVIDQNMIVNVFETNSQEAAAVPAGDPVAGRSGSGSICCVSPDAHSHRKMVDALLTRFAAMLGALLVIILSRQCSIKTMLRCSAITKAS
ncbi:phosphoethanolamine transferase domain-containing protein [Enterobacter hormaechei]